MLSRLVLATSLAMTAAVCGFARDPDHLRKGEEKLWGQSDRDYMRAVHTILARGWRGDVVVRMLDLPAGPPEAAIGIARTRAGYHAFEAKASTGLWGALSDLSGHIKHDYRGLHAVVHDRPLSDALSARIAALWRHVLTDPRNYGEETKIYVDANVFTFDLRFLPREHLTAHSTSAGVRTEQLILVARAIGNFARGGPESELSKAVAKAERTIGI